MGPIEGARSSVLLLFLISLLGVRAFAQVDFSGEWTPIRQEDQGAQPNSLPGDYLGIPINDAARFRADTWSASVWTLPEWQCRPQPIDYMKRSGPQTMRIEKEVDPVTRQITAYHVDFLAATRNTIYMDGRPHPSENAEHTWFGFSTGEWIGDMLKVTTTHVKDAHIRRNGIHRSDEAKIIEYLIRRADILTSIIIIHDPIYLEEPLIRSSEYQLDVHSQVRPFPCDVVQEVERPKGVVPHWLPGENSSLDAFAKYWQLPFEATRGGAETIYPEYLPKLRQLLRENSVPAKK